MWASLRAILVVTAIVLVGRFVLTRILAIATRQQNGPAFVCVTFLAVLAAALASERAGLSMALGTFLLGATLSMSEFGHRIAMTVEPVKSTLLALFFLSIGLSVDLQVVAESWDAAVVAYRDDPGDQVLGYLRAASVCASPSRRVFGCRWPWLNAGSLGLSFSARRSQAA